MEIRSRCFEKDEFRKVYQNIIDKIIKIVSEVEILYGAAWGNEIYKDEKVWNPETILSENISTHVDDNMRKGYGDIGDDDLFITIKDKNIEIVICHERDLHITYNIEDENIILLKNAIIISDWHWIKANEYEKWKRIKE